MTDVLTDLCVRLVRAENRITKIEKAFHAEFPPPDLDEFEHMATPALDKAPHADANAEMQHERGSCQEMLDNSESEDMKWASKVLLDLNLSWVSWKPDRVREHLLELISRFKKQKKYFDYAYEQVNADNKWLKGELDKARRRTDAAVANADTYLDHYERAMKELKELAAAQKEIERLKAPTRDKDNSVTVEQTIFCPKCNEQISVESNVQTVADEERERLATRCDADVPKCSDAEKAAAIAHIAVLLRAGKRHKIEWQHGIDDSINFWVDDHSLTEEWYGNLCLSVLRQTAEIIGAEIVERKENE